MYLGIDLGTSAVKALLINDHNKVLAEAEQSLTVARRKRLWSEQNPADWWTAVMQSIQQLRTQQGQSFQYIRGIGLSGQMHGAVVLNQARQPLRPAILWNDGRAYAQCKELEETLPDLPWQAGVVAMPGFTAPKLLWLRQHEPEVFAAIDKILLPKDYIRLCLSGELITDMSDAAGTLWLDQARRQWNPAALAACGLQLEQMPELVEGSAVAGTLRADIAAELGLPAGIVIAGGGGDAATGGAGIGAINSGDGFISLGTSGQFFVASDRYQPKPEVLLHSFAHCVPERWYQMAAMLNGASCLAWAAKMLGEPDIGALLTRVEAAWQAPSEVIFLPYLSGERTPHNNPYAKGVWFGMTANTTPLDLFQAVLEGVAFSLADARDCLQQAGTLCDQPGVIGGGARSRFWLQILADILGLPLARYQGGAKGPAFGAARLARLAVENGDPAVICPQPEVAEVIAPRIEYTEQYCERLQQFRVLYRQLEGQFNP